VGLADPTWQLPVLHFGLVPSGVFWSLLVHFVAAKFCGFFDNLILFSFSLKYPY
jgi:hypothetical protein